MVEPNKFMVSNKLVGREVELEELRTIYRQHVRDDTTNATPPANAKAVYVKGLSGTGKSRLVVEALQSIVESEGGYFCQGKFDLNQSLRPFAALSDALNDLCAKARKDIEGNEEARKKIEKVSDKETSRAVLSVVPNLKYFLTPSTTESSKASIMEDVSLLSPFSSSPASVTSSTLNFGDGQQQLSSTLAVQFKILFGKYMNACMTDRTLVMFIDDLQWADSCSIDLMGTLISNLPAQRFLFVGGFRSDEVNQDHYLGQFLEKAAKDDAVPATIMSIHHVTPDDVGAFIADTVMVNDDDMERIAPLAKLVHEKTQGNIFYVRQLVDSLHQSGHIFYCLRNFRWEWESLSAIRDATGAEFSMGKVVSKKILKLPKDTVDALKLAACIGCRFDLDVIEYVCLQWWKNSGKLDSTSTVDDIQMDDVLWNAVEDGLLEEVCGDVMAFSSSMQYKFTHDKVQTAAYSLIGDATKEYHLAVGKYLLQYYRESEEDRKWLLVIAADHLYKSESIVSSQDERDEYAEVSLLASKELECNAAFKSAAVYCRNAIHLLGEDSFERKYELSLNLYNMSATMESCAGDKAASDDRIDTILESARCLSDKYTAYYVRIMSCHQINEFDKGLEVAYQVLREMNVTKLPKKIKPPHVIYEMLTVFRAVDKLSTDELLNKQTTEDHAVAQFTMFMMQATLCCLATDPNTLCFLVLKAVQVSLRRGYSTSTPTFFAFCGFLRVAITGNFKEADRIGGIGLRLSERFNAPQADVVTKYVYYGGVQWLFGRKPDCPKFCNEIRKIGFQCGDSGWGCIGGAAAISCHQLYGSERLDKLNALALASKDEMVLYDKLTFYFLVRATRQVLLNLLGQSRDPARLEGDEIKSWDEFEAGLPTMLSWRFSLSCRLMLAQYFHDMDNAEELATLSAKHWKDDYPFFNTVVLPVHQCLLWSSLFNCRGKQAKFKRQFRKSFKIAATWRKSGSPIATVLCTLIEALQKSTFEDCSPNEISDAYTEAMTACTDFGLPSFSMIAAERAGMYFAEVDGHEDKARSFLKKAIQGYQEWRAAAKVRDIEERYSHILELQPV